MRNILYTIGGSLCLLLFMTGCNRLTGRKPRVIDLGDGSCRRAARLL